MTTNQAFIKAFRQDSPQGGPVRPISKPASRPLTGVPDTSVEYVSVGAGQFASTYDTRLPLPTREAPSLDLASASSRAPLIEGATAWPACDAPFGRIDAPVPSGKRPLSALTAQSRAAEQGRRAMTRVGELEPATTVASFSWPSVCRTLCQQCGPDFDRLAELLVAQAEDGRSLVGVLGMFPGRGSTTTLLCLAKRLASRGRRIIIVEGNFVAPKLSAWLDAEPTAWWQDVLERGVPLADAVIRAADDGLDLLPLRADTADPLSLASSVNTSTTAGALRDTYELALIDLGAFFDPVSQPIAMELVRNMRIDVALAVSGPDGADPRDVATVAEYLEQRNCNLLGMVENRAQSALLGNCT